MGIFFSISGSATLLLKSLLYPSPPLNNQNDPYTGLGFGFTISLSAMQCIAGFVKMALG